MPPRIDIYGDDWLPEDDESNEENEGSYSEDYDNWQFDGDFLSLEEGW